MIRSHTRRATRWAAPLAVLTTAALVGCTTAHRLGWVLGITDDAPSAEAEAQTPQTQLEQPGVEDGAPGGAVDAAGFEVTPAALNDQGYGDPFAGADVSDGSGAAARTTWSATPAASVFGEISDSYMGPASSSQLQTGAQNLDQVSYATEGSDFDPDISPDGTFIVYSSTQHARTADVYRQSVGGHTITQLTSDQSNDVMPVVSPDGTRIAFASDRDGTWDIYVMNAGGGQAVQLTSDPAPQLHPTWSPDNRFIAYCRLGETSGRWELWVTEVMNSGVRHFIGYGLLPDWSPSGHTIAFQRSRQRGDRFFSIWTIDYENGEGRNPTEIVSSSAAACVNPSFSPDGNRIAFAVIPNPDLHRDGKPEVADLWITDVDGTGRANLTGGLFANLMPTWGVDGRIFFISDRSGTENVWSLKPARAILAASGPFKGDTDVAGAEGSAKNKKNSAQAELATIPDDGGNQ